MSSESQSQSSSSSCAESSSNFSAPIAKEAKRIRPKTAKVKVTKFRKTGFEEDEEIDEYPPAKKPAPIFPIFPTFFHQELLINIPLFNNAATSVFETADEKTSLNELATVDTTTSSLLAFDGEKKRTVHFADDIGKKLVEAKYYERYLYLFQRNSTTTDDANVRNQHLNEAEPLKNAFDRFDGSDESSSNSFASVNEHTLEQENVASTSQADAKDFASFLDSLSRSTLTSNRSIYNVVNQDDVEPVFASNPNPLFLTNYNVVDTITSPQSNGGSKYDQNDNEDLLDPRYSKQRSSYKKHYYHQSDSSNRYERNDYQRERSLSRHHHRRRSPDEYRGRSRRGRSPVEYRGRNRHSPSPDNYYSRSRDYGNFKSHRQQSSRSTPPRSLSYEKKKKSHHSRTRKFSRSSSRDRF